MPFWKDKSGLKVQASEPTVIEETLDQINQLHHAEHYGMSHNNKLFALDARLRLRRKMMNEQGVLPVERVDQRYTELFSDFSDFKEFLRRGR